MSASKAKTKQASLFSFFTKKSSNDKDGEASDVLTPSKRDRNSANAGTTTPKSNKNGKPSTPGSVRAKLPSESELKSKFKEYDIVWARLDGYPWWPSMVVLHPTQKNYVKVEKKMAYVHVQFFDDPPSRGFVKFKYIEPFTGSNSKEFERGGKFHSSDADCFKGAQQADKALKMKRDDRRELLVELLSTSESEDEEDEPPEKMNFDDDIFDAEVDEDEKNVSNGSKENHAEDEETKKTPSKSSKGSGRSKRRAAKRRKILVGADDTLDDSEDEFKPDGDDSSEDEGSSGVDEDDVSEPESESGVDSPVKKGRKRKMNDTSKSKESSPKSPQGVVRTGRLPSKTKKSLNRFTKKSDDSDEEEAMDTSVSKSPSNSKPAEASTPSRSASFTPTVSNKTKSKLASFTAADNVAKPTDAPADVKMPHLKLDFLQPDKIRDANKKRPDDPDYNPKTLHVPESYLNSLTPGVRQWWGLKSQHYDCVIFFKVGKFYELYHMDAVTGVTELGLIYMKGEFAHCGFPEIGFRRYADSLIQKGYRVARVEQTETPDMANDRCKKMFKATKFDRVVKREICRIQTKGTKVFSFIDGDVAEAKSAYLLAVCEREEGDSLNSTYGVAFVDTSIGKFYMGQFEDDRYSSRLRTVVSHYQPAEVLYERGKISNKTQQIFKNSLMTALKTPLRPGAEFWDSSKTLKCLAEGDYFVDENDKDAGLKWPPVLKGMISDSDSLCQTASEDKELAIRSLGAIVWYLKDSCTDYEVLSLRSFEEYNPIDQQVTAVKEDQAESASPFVAGQKMVLDGVTLANLEIVENSAGTLEGTLLERMDHCNTAFGKRLFKQWLCAPLCHPDSINDRLDAVEDLMAVQDVVTEAQEKMKKLPDLERVLSKFHTLGSANRNKSHPDGRAIFFEDVTYSKRKIEDLLCALEGFALAVKIIKGFTNVAKDFKSKLLQSCVKLQDDDGRFPDLSENLKFFENAFDHAKAKTDGFIKPRPGVDEDYDQAVKDILTAKSELDEYVAEQKKALSCRTINLYGTAKNRFQLEIPETVRVPDDYEVTSSKKGFKRYWTQDVKEFLARTTDAEDRRDAALKDTMRKIFFAFDKHYKMWNDAVQCLAVLDVLLSLSEYSRCGDGVMCRPELVAPQDGVRPFLEIREGRHPCISRTFAGGDFIPNDTVVGIKDENDMEVDEEDHSNSLLVLITGPNMGGKSTLMRQVGIITVIAQMGCFVPSEKCRLTPVDRVFTRLGATDRIMAGESTFFVELSETSAILQHSSPHSLVLLDELGRGTATYDGTAIACAVVQHLSQKARCRSLFSTHYHSLVEEFTHDPNIRLGHMACMVENENDEDPSQETITFLYKFVKGACPKSYGFNAARLAHLPEDIIQAAQRKAREFENTNVKLHLFRKFGGDVPSALESLQQLQSAIPAQ